MKAKAGTIFGLVCLTATHAAPEASSGSCSGWGVDACISWRATPCESDAYIAQLQKARLTFVRERYLGDLDDPANRDTGRLSVFRKLHGAGMRVVAFSQAGAALQPTQPDDQLPEDLLAVYRDARQMSAKAGDLVNVWEMVGEPDTAYCHDLPDRVAAFQKAVYLGIKDGAKDAAHCMPGVLMGALGHAPGPWLARAARNGLYEYTDGLNFHFYGHAGDLQGVIEAHRDFARACTKGRELPLWITESGINTMPEGKPDDPRARQLQREFIVETARIAVREKVAVFMPFVFLGGAGDGHSLTKSSSVPYPAWTAYAALTRIAKLPAGRALIPPPAPSRIVLQWMPDNLTCIPHKVSGAYWFDNEEGDSISMEGKFVIYNFSDMPVSGDVETMICKGVRMRRGATRQAVKIPALSCVRLPVTFVASAGRYLRGEVEVSFQQAGAGVSSNLVFGLETRPSDALLSRILPIPGRRPDRWFEWIWAPQPYRTTSRGGPWRGVCGVKVGDGDAEITAGDLGTPWRFQVIKRQTDPRFPPMAITRVEGLPDVSEGFLRLRLSDEAAARDMAIRVDLVDRLGQRFSVSEEVGRNWIDPVPQEAFLAYRDFHPYFWGRCTKKPVFRPTDIREIQLRFYPRILSAPVDVRLDVVAPAQGGQP